MIRRALVTGLVVAAVLLPSLVYAESSASDRIKVLREYNKKRGIKGSRGFFPSLFGGAKKKSIRTQRRATLLGTAGDDSKTFDRFIQAEISKNKNAKTLCVFGSNYAPGLADGLRTEFLNDPTVKVKHGFFPSLSFRDKSEQGYSLPCKADYHIVMLDHNELKPVSDQDKSYEFASEKWNEIYQTNLLAFSQLHKAQGGLFFIVSLPPVGDAEVNDKALVLNPLLRLTLSQTHGQFIDTWNVFISDDGIFKTTGTNVLGEIDRLRSSDGYGFSASGNRKLAFYVARILRRFLPALYKVATLPVKLNAEEVAVLRSGQASGEIDIQVLTAAQALEGATFQSYDEFPINYSEYDRAHRRFVLGRPMRLPDDHAGSSLEVR